MSEIRKVVSIKNRSNIAYAAYVGPELLHDVDDKPEEPHERKHEPPAIEGVADV
ncbi:MAG: hypothetical protein WB249_01105 [Candidatus Sulfotelmatobacter sp.]